MENLHSFKMLLLKILLQRWKEKLYSEEPCRQALYWVKWSLLVMGQMKIMCPLIKKRTQLHFCDIPARHAQSKSNHEKTNSEGQFTK